MSRRHRIDQLVQPIVDMIDGLQPRPLVVVLSQSLHDTLEKLYQVKPGHVLTICGLPVRINPLLGTGEFRFAWNN